MLDGGGAPLQRGATALDAARVAARYPASMASPAPTVLTTFWTGASPCNAPASSTRIGAVAAQAGQHRSPPRVPAGLGGVDDIAEGVEVVSGQFGKLVGVGFDEVGARGQAGGQRRPELSTTTFTPA